MKELKLFFDKNKEWANKIKNEDPEFFTKLSKQQNPEYLWIGCSDSRVPATQIVDKLPGEIFVHRNIGNLVIHTDLNCLSVIQYAVDVLKVKHIIICGHYDCGAIKASLENRSHGLIDNWLQNIRDVYRFYRHKLDNITNQPEKVNKLCEINVFEQVQNLCKTTIVQNAWSSGQNLTIHGWIYSVENGILKDLELCIKNREEADLVDSY